MSYGTVQAEKVTTESGYSLGAGNASSFKNRIINGGMTISQRGTSFSGNPNGYTLDRFTTTLQTPSSVTTTQSTDAPTGFVNSLLVTVTTGGTIGSSLNYIAQYIEGNNVADFAFGTSSAKSVTISFWVKSSVTGTFGGSLRNFTAAPATTFRAYPYTYTINSANTWEQKTITIAGDGVSGAGQWNTGTQGSFAVFFDLGSTSAYTGTANAWVSANYIGVTGTQTTLMTGSGNTFYMTGLQLEAGTVATSFDFRSYGTELNLCQRYCEVLSFDNDQYTGACGFATTGGSSYFSQPWTQVKRTIPSFTFSGTNYQGQGLADTNSPSGMSSTRISLTAANLYLTASFSGTNGQAVCLRSMANSQKMIISAEL